MSKNKWVLLTGATGLIGRRYLKDLLDKDYNVAFTSHTQSSINDIMDIYNKSNKIMPIYVDFLQDDAVESVIATLQEKNINPYALVNNAYSPQKFEDPMGLHISKKLWDNDFLFNVYLPYALTMALCEQGNSLLKNVINISSMYGIVAPTLSIYAEDEFVNPIHYGVTKAALIHLSKQLAVRLSQRKIHVNTISYGGVEGRTSEDFKQRYAARCPESGMLTLDNVSGALLFLLSDASKGMTGHNLVVDGGWTAC